MNQPPTNPAKRPPPSRPSVRDPAEGILLVDKPVGPTSHDIVFKIRKHFKLRKVGHGGTLDPMATGLLVILIGRGTKLSNRIMTSDKTYEGTMHLGIETDSQDLDGEVLSERDPSAVTREALERELEKRTGDLMQTPPMVSAVKIDGVPLYKLARKGKTVERDPRLIHVFEFTLLDFDLPLAGFRLTCTKGTYVRTLCAEAGVSLGCGAHLSQLRRTRSGDLDVAQALSLEDVLALTTPQLVEKIIPVHRILREGRPHGQKG